MKKRSMCLSACCLALLSSPFVSADMPLGDQSLNIVRTNCVGAQQIIQTFQRAELVTRSNRSNKYEDILRLLAAFNARASVNKIDISAQTTLVSDLNKQLDNFRRDTYPKYDDQLNRLTTMNCREKPSEFYQLLIDTRSTRAELSRELDNMSLLLDQFSNSVDKLRADIKSGKVGSAQ